MKHKKAFTLLELLIASAISGFIILGIMQGYRNAQKIHIRTRKAMDANHVACIFFNQIERDFTTAFIPPPEEKLSKKKPGAKKEDPEQAKETNGKDKEKKKFFNFFKSDIYEDESKKIEFKKYELFKFVNFINTNPFQVWGQKRARFVRVLYSLVKDKKNSKGDRTVYKLFRKETSDIKNETFKEPEIINRKKPEHPIRTHLVAKNIKELFIEYTMPKTEEQKKQDYREEEKEFKTFVWGKEKETKSKNFEQKNIVPQYVSIRVTFWDDDFKEENTFQCMFPIFSYKEQIEKKDDKKKDGAPNKKESNATDEKK